MSTAFRRGEVYMVYFSMIIPRDKDAQIVVKSLGMPRMYHWIWQALKYIQIRTVRAVLITRFGSVSFLTSSTPKLNVDETMLVQHWKHLIGQKAIHTMWVLATPFNVIKNVTQLWRKNLNLILLYYSKNYNNLLIVILVNVNW